MGESLCCLLSCEFEFELFEMLPVEQCYVTADVRVLFYLHIC